MTNILNKNDSTLTKCFGGSVKKQTLIKMEEVLLHPPFWEKGGVLWQAFCGVSPLKGVAKFLEGLKGQFGISLDLIPFLGVNLWIFCY